MDELYQNKLNPLTVIEYISMNIGIELKLNRINKAKDPGTRPKLPSQLMYVGFGTKGSRNIYQNLSDKDCVIPLESKGK